MKTPFRYRVPGAAAQLLRGLHPQIRRKLRAGLDLLAREPQAGKPLRAEFAGLRSLRAGRFRIVYRVGRGRTVEIVAVGPRTTIYGETLRLIEKDGG